MLSYTHCILRLTLSGILNRELILQPFRRFTQVTAHSPTLPLLHLLHRSHSPTFPSLHLRHNSFYNPSVALPMSRLILNRSVASPTSYFILQPSFRFAYVRSSPLTSPGEPPMTIIGHEGFGGANSKICIYSAYDNKK